MVEALSYQTPKARKEHVCEHCRRPIARGSKYSATTYKHDYVYTIKAHMDCVDAFQWFIRKMDPLDDDGGYPSLETMVFEFDGQDTINMLRGYFPHVACRLEYRLQMRNADDQ